MMTNYKIVFGLRVSHSYFEDNVCPYLSFYPSAETDKWMKRFLFKTRKWKNGIDVYVNTKQETQKYLRYIATAVGTLGFDFSINNDDSQFTTYTNLPMNWGGQLFYYSSDFFEEKNENILLKPTLMNQTSSSKIGNVKILFQDIENTDKSKVIFSIDFQSRATLWHYYIINKSTLNLDSSSVISKSKITFSKLKNIVIETGEEALVFTSDDVLIPLSEKPKYKFDLITLVENDNSISRLKSVSQKIIIKGLPNPNPEKTGLIEVNGKIQPVSLMYVYV